MGISLSTSETSTEPSIDFGGFHENKNLGTSRDDRLSRHHCGRQQLANFNLRRADGHAAGADIFTHTPDGSAASSDGISCTADGYTAREHRDPGSTKRSEWNHPLRTVAGNQRKPVG